MDPLDQIMDALDIETFFVCKDEAEGRRLAVGLMEKLKFASYDIVFIKYQGPGARVRIRAYVHKPGDNYSWLEGIS